MNALLEKIANDIGTPCYVYDEGVLLETFATFKENFSDIPALICVAVKANPNPALLKVLGDTGAGADIVSGGELYHTTLAHISPHKIVFSGVGKSDADIANALSLGIHQLNIESAAELALVGEIATSLNIIAPIAIRINPDVDAVTHAKITTGKHDNKFGVALDEAATLYDRAFAHPYLNPIGVAMHIGSQLTTLDPFEGALDRAISFTMMLRGKGIPIRRLDIGGGLGVRYTDENPPSIAHYAHSIKHKLKPTGLELILEPGRILLAGAGRILSRILYRKETPTRQFMVIDAAMNDLMRPALYDARHPIKPLALMDGQHSLVDIVGPVCESSDSFGLYSMPMALKRGDIITIGMAGAYGASMSHTYNSRLLIPEVLVTDAKYRLIRRRPTIMEQTAWYCP
jgi:diaminopimelate decarboxylase